MEPELKPRWSGSRARPLTQDVTAPLTHPDSVAPSRSLTFSSGGPRVGRSTGVENQETGAQVLALLLASV